MRFVLVMAAREMRASWRRLLFFFVCIAIGVGAIVALRSVIQSVRVVFAREARVLMGADVAASSNRPFGEEVTARMAARVREARAESHQSVELATMVRPPDGPAGVARMVELKAVEPAFPFYGAVELAGGQVYSHALLRDFGALVAPELLTELGIGVGDGVQIGGHRFTIRGTIEAEPGRRMGAFSFGPRVIVDLADLRRTGLVTFGSRASFQWFVRVPDAGLDALVAALRQDLANSFVRVRSYKAAEDDVSEDFQRAEDYLSLVGLVVVILGGIGVSGVMRVFVQQKIRSIAVLKCIGGRSAQLLAVYMLQVVSLGLAGSLLGVALAGAAIRAIPATMAAAATRGLDVDYGLTPAAVAQGIGIGLLVSVLFSLVPLLDVRHVKPSLLLRQEAGAPARDWLRYAVMALTGGGVLALTVWQAGSVRVGLVVAAGFVLVSLALHAAGHVLIRLIAPLARSGWFPLRHAVLQVSRPGSQARAVLLAVGLGSFFIVGVRSLQVTLVQEFTVNMSEDAPDMFLLDIQPDQVTGVRALLDARRVPGAGAARVLPVLRARVIGVDGRDVSLESYEQVRRRGSLGREYTITYRGALERNEEVVAGRFWDGPSGPDAGEVSIEESLKERFHIEVGDTMRFDVMGRTVSARVTSVRRVNWSDGRAGGFMFVFSPGLFDAAPHAYVAFLRGPDAPAARGRLQADLVSSYPNVSVIDGREIFRAIRAVVDNVVLAVTVVGTLVVASGLLILVGAVAMTKFRRIYEAAVFKTLGATRRAIATMLLIEYGVLGGIAGTIGSTGAMLLTWGVSRFALDIPWRVQPAATATGVLASALLVAAVGVVSSWDVLARKPLATLRAE